MHWFRFSIHGEEFKITKLPWVDQVKVIMGTQELLYQVEKKKAILIEGQLDPIYMKELEMRILQYYEPNRYNRKSR